MPLTSCSGEYPDMFRFLRILTKEWTHFLKWFRMSVFFSAISVMRPGLAANSIFFCFLFVKNH